jgi:beta-xylosidase
MRSKLFFAAASLGAWLTSAATAWSGNPIVPGWYADPEIHVFGDEYWIYPTYSDHSGKPDVSPAFTQEQLAERRHPERVYPPFLMQTFFNAFSSRDLVHWTKHSHVLDVKDVSWASYAVWAPSVIEANGKYFLFFGANDIKTNGQLGGIGVAVGDSPRGPFRDALGKPLIGTIENGAQPIDMMVFRDDDGKVYMFYGGWKHCNVVQLATDMKRLVPFPDGTTFREVTPSPDYVEGPYMIKRRGIYYLMWSENDWTGPNYQVAYATAPTALGPFTPRGVVLKQDAQIARGAGHHSVLNIPGTDDWYVAYHRRPLQETDGNHRELALERLFFDEDGAIVPVKITLEGVPARTIKAARH